MEKKYALLMMSMVMAFLLVGFASAQTDTINLTNPDDGFTDQDGTINFTADIGTNVTSCTLTFPNNNPGSDTYSMTNTSSICYKELTNIPSLNYDWRVDGVNDSTNVQTVERSFTVDTGGAPSNYDPDQQDVSTTQDSDEGDEGTNIPVWVWIVGAVVVAWIFMQSRK